MTQPSFKTVLKMLVGSLGETLDLPLRAFDDLVPHLAHLDQCYLTLSEVSPPELAGVYRVVDLYCQDPSCHCHKVSLMMVDQNQKIYATISYGWKSKTFYRKWGLDKEAIQSLTYGFLDPWAQQSEHSPLFLKAFLFSLKRDPNFIARLKSRYSFFKEALAFDPSLIMDYPDDDLPENVIPLNSSKRR
jgi:hypothetical protein